MSGSLSAPRVALLVGDFDRAPAYAGLAAALRLLIGDGRITLDTRLPSERDLCTALELSRTTVTRAYADLCESGYAEARQGSGTFTRVPHGRTRVHDHALLPYSGDEDAIDLNCAAASAPPGVAAAYAEALADLPAHLGGHGYFPAGLPQLQTAIAARYTARGLPTEPGQIMVTPGALSAVAVVAQAFSGPGVRTMVETPVYPNATQAIRHSGARVIGSPVHLDGWDLDAVGSTLRRSRPRLAYLIADFQNPTGHVMTSEQRASYADHLARSRTLGVVDEAHVDLALEGQEMPPPFASFSPDAISVGSASKTFWGGLRLGWLRAGAEQMRTLTRARVGLDLGAPVFEQLVLTRLLADDGSVLTEHRARLRDQRDRLVLAVTRHLPEWRFRMPAGGLALWCELPTTGAGSLVAEAENRGVILAPGPLFAAEGGLDRFVRIPWTLPGEQLEEAVVRLAAGWAAVRTGDQPRPRILVA